MHYKALVFSIQNSIPVAQNKMQIISHFFINSKGKHAL